MSKPDAAGGPPVLEPARALAWSEGRVDAAAQPRPGFALWRPAGMTVAIGLAQRPEAEVEFEAMRRDHVDLVRRQSGGGAVLLCPGVVCWEAWGALDSVAEGEGDAGIRQAYAFFSRPVVGGLAGMGLNAVRAGICDLSVAWGTAGELRKVAGTAQLRRRANALVHGSLLVAPDMELLARYLRCPSDQPEYRRGRTHRDFCLSLAEYFSIGQGGAGDFIRLAAGCITAEAERLGWEVATPPAEADEAMLALEKNKYRNEGWNWKRERLVRG